MWKKKLVIVDPFIFDPFTDEHRKLLADEFPGLETVDCTQDRERVKEAIQDADFVFGSITEEEFRRAERLEFIQVFSQGVEHMHYAALLDSGVRVANAKGIWSPVIAEHVLALMLAHYRNLPGLFRDQQRAEWNNDFEQFSMLRGRTVGFLGTGDIARHIVALLGPFACVVTGYNLRGRQDGFDGRVASGDGLGGFLGEADVVVNSLPVTPQTERFVDGAAFAQMKRTALFINVGRGKTVDERALIKALEEGAIGAAALDVFEEEPLPPESPLWRMPNVIVSSHKAGLGRHDYAEALFDLLVENLRRLRAGREPANLIDKTLGY